MSKSYFPFSIFRFPLNTCFTNKPEKAKIESSFIISKIYLEKLCIKNHFI
jgi:hypothetical protein